MLNNSDYQEDFNYYKTLSLKDNKKSVEIEQYCTDEQYQKGCANCHAYGLKDANDKIQIPCASCAGTGKLIGNTTTQRVKSCTFLGRLRIKSVTVRQCLVKYANNA